MGGGGGGEGGDGIESGGGGGGGEEDTLLRGRQLGHVTIPSPLSPSCINTVRTWRL